MSPRASLARSWRWTSFAPSGAAIMKTMSAGRSSSAPKSTGSASRAKPRLAVSTWALRQCGIAMPPGMPVGAVASRARASPARPLASSARPESPILRARNLMTSLRCAPGAASSATSSGVMSGVCSLGWSSVIVPPFIVCLWLFSWFYVEKVGFVGLIFVAYLGLTMD